MTLDEDILNFEIWATKLGFPQNVIPSRDALRSIFKSPRQRELFFNMIERVKPRQEVQEIRENILIRKMDKLKGQVVPACSRSFLPKEMQRFVKVKDLRARKTELESKTTELVSQYNALSNSIKTKNMQSIKLKQKLECQQAKVDMLDLKVDKLRSDLQKEKANKQRIIATMPVKLTPSNANENVAMAAVEEAIKELDSFYTLILNNSNPHLVQEAKDDMWRKMRKVFANIPNFLIFNSILKIKEDQLQNIMILNKTPCTAPLKENLSAFDLKFLKAKAALLGMAANYMSARQESYALNQRFSIAYTQFVEAVQCKVNLFSIDNTEDDLDDIISNYIVQYNTRIFNKSQNDYIVGQIELCKAQIESGNKQLENHEILLNSIKQVYTDIDSSINRIQYEVMQLHQMKEKILFSKNMLHHLLLGDMQQLEQQSSHHYLPSSSLMGTMKMSGNLTTASGDSNSTFDMSIAGNVFSSTKLDFDATLLNSSSCTATTTARNCDVTIMPGAIHSSRYILPPILTEICTFMETPFEKFSCVTKECAFYLMANPLITESHELSSTIQLAPGLLLTPHGCLQEVKRRVAWSDSINNISSELKINSITISPGGVNSATMRAKSKQQREQLVELLDRIEVADINTNRLLRKATKYYSFLLKNPLKNYIPSTKCLNNQTYSDYESEYQTYYRMVTMGNFNK